MTSAAPSDAKEGWRALGVQLAAYRKAAGYTQESLAAHERITYGRSTVANVECGRQPIGRAFWEECDAVLGSSGTLSRGYDQIARAASDQRLASISSLASRRSHLAVTEMRDHSWIPTVYASGAVSAELTQAGAERPIDGILLAPPGRALSGVSIPAQLHRAVIGKHVEAQVPADYASAIFLRQPGRALVVGQVPGEVPQAFVMDSRHARRRLRGAADQARLLVPRGYRLDELTFALLWAVANYDAALLADDAVIAASMLESDGYTRMEKSAASRDIAADASPASLMWLGSKFCADHIRRHLPRLACAPVFWTREQRGEEAATWLLFAHKHEYLRDTAPAAGAADAVMRVFCIPRSAVAGSPLGERALLVLAAALMESHRIHTAVTDSPELAAMPGFVSDRQRRAITATWVGADGIWYVDVTDNRSTVREYDDACGHGISHSVTAGETPHRRLRALAEYLDVSWAWLVTRCVELADWGTSGIARPHSRLLSLAGVDRACQFIADAHHSSD